MAKSNVQLVRPDTEAATQLSAEVDRLQAELAAARAKVAELEAKADVDSLLDILNRRGFERELAARLPIWGVMEPRRR